MPIPSASANQGTLPLIGLDDELSGLREEVTRLRTENARLMRLLDLTPQQAHPPGPVQTGVFDGRRLVVVDECHHVPAAADPRRLTR